MNKIRLNIKQIMEPYKGKRKSPRASLYMDLFVIICIIISCLLIPIGYFYPKTDYICWKLEIIFTVIFSIEYLLRWYSASNRILYPFTLYAIIDFLAIIPTILIVNADFILLPMFRSLRLLRLLRLLKFIRYGFFLYRSINRMRIWFDAISHHYRLNQMKLLFFAGIIAWIIGSNILYLTESSPEYSDSPFYSYWQSYWHVIIVLISGIEDKEPLSILGRIEISLFLILGICFAGVITAQLVSILVRKMNRLGKITLMPPKSVFKHHIVIIAYNNHFGNVIRQVNAGLKHKNYILIVCRRGDQIKISDPETYRNVLALNGDPLNRNILKIANIESASRVIILSSDNEKNDTPVERDNRSLMKALAVLSCNPTIPLTVELKSYESFKYSQSLAGVDFILASYFGERLLSQAVIHPGVTEVYLSLMTLTDDSSEFYVIPVPSQLVGRTFKQAQLYFFDMDDEPIILVGIDRSPVDFPSSNFKICPVSTDDGLSSPDLELEANDNLIIIAYTQPSFVELDENDLWSGRILLRD